VEPRARDDEAGARPREAARCGGRDGDLLQR
jgi:hypothetical protein